MKKLIIACCAIMLLLTMISCSNTSDSIVGSDSSDQEQTIDRGASAKTSETGYAEKPQKTEIPEPGTGP